MKNYRTLVYFVHKQCPADLDEVRDWVGDSSDYQKEIEKWVKTSHVQFTTENALELYERRDEAIEKFRQHCYPDYHVLHVTMPGRLPPNDWA